MNVNFTQLISRHFRVILGVLCAFFAILLPVTIYYIYNSPPDYLQKSSVYIMYIHVPSAWISIILYLLLALFSFTHLVYKNISAFLLARSIAPVGLLFTICALVTGSIWGAPTWGTYWVWDARLTSMLLLAFIYSGYIAITSYVSIQKSANIASYYALIGLINIPIIKLSVYFWATLHQKSSIFSDSGVKIHEAMRYVLLLSFIELLILSLIIIVLQVKLHMLKLKFKKFANKSFLLALSAVFLSSFFNNEAKAGAWTVEKGKSYVSASMMTSSDVKYDISGFYIDNFNDELDYIIGNKISKSGFTLDKDFGIENDLSLMTSLDFSFYKDKIKVNATLNNTQNIAYDVATNYLVASPSIGVKKKWYDGAYGLFSTELDMYLGDFVDGRDDVFFIDRKAALAGYLMYAQSFNIPFGSKNRPKLGNYIDISAGLKRYLTASRLEVDIETSVGIKPINDRLVFVASLDNTFNGYSYVKRPFPLQALANDLAALNVSNESAELFANDFLREIEKTSVSPFHQLGFQIGYDFSKKNDGSTVLYFKSYHGILKGKPFKDNSFYITLDYYY